MSYTRIFYFDKSGTAEFLGETHNSHRGAMAVWRFLEDKYLPKEHVPRFISDKMDEVWKLHKDERLSDVERICHRSTFDNAVIRRENLPKLLEAYKQFPHENTSLPEQAKVIEEAIEKLGDEITAIAFNQTSVNADEWVGFHGYDEEDEPINYNLNKDDAHWFLFDL
jgi:hypothetical protein